MKNYFHKFLAAIMLIGLTVGSLQLAVFATTDNNVQTTTTNEQTISSDNNIASMENEMNARALDADATLPEVITPKVYTSKDTARIGEKMIYYLDGLSYQSSSVGLTDIGYNHFTEYWDKTAEIQSIVIPRVEGEIGGQARGVTITVGALASGYNHIKQETFMLGDGKSEIVISRDEILAFNEAYNNGIFPGQIRIHFTPVDASGNEIYFTPMNKMIADGPIEFHYTVVDAAAYNNNYYQLFSGEIDWYTTDLTNRTGVNVGSYPKYETSDLVVTANKYEDLLPGELIDLTFTITNNSSMRNRLWLGFDAEGLILERPETSAYINHDFDATSWYGDANNFDLPLFKNGAWIDVNPSETHTVTQTFKIADDYTGTTIDVLPYLFVNSAKVEREYDPTLTLQLINDNGLTTPDVTDNNSSENNGSVVLPETGVNQIEWLLAGAGLLLAASVLIVMKRK
ncbi:LPXTG cell wall anchor domain-containing protein [Culicoidibacter larvae]|nr:LPXTG cell wall anchor domain-containing protein [Culicoidibacter larvae]